jgi:hypothetical protein
MTPSLANSGYGAIFSVGTASGSPLDITYAPVSEIATINKKNFTVPSIDVTHLQSPDATGEMIPGIIKPGTVEMTGNFIGDGTQLQFTTLARARAVFPFQITAPMQKNTKVYTGTGTCFVTDYETGPFEADKKIDFKVTLQVTGTVVEAVA